MKKVSSRSEGRRECRYSARMRAIYAATQILCAFFVTNSLESAGSSSIVNVSTCFVIVGRNLGCFPRSSMAKLQKFCAVDTVSSIARVFSTGSLLMSSRASRQTESTDFFLPVLGAPVPWRSVSPRRRRIDIPCCLWLTTAVTKFQTLVSIVTSWYGLSTVTRSVTKWFAIVAPRYPRSEGGSSGFDPEALTKLSRSSRTYLL